MRRLAGHALQELERVPEIGMAAEQGMGFTGRRHETITPKGDTGGAAIAMAMAMLFVRCRDGVSHHPAEHVEAADVEVAVRVLAALLRDLDREADDGR